MLLGTVIVTVSLSLYLRPRLWEKSIISAFGEQGSIDRSTLLFFDPTRIDKLLGFDGFIESVYLDGGDPNIAKQLVLLTRAAKCQKLTAHNVEVTWNANATDELSTLTEASFSFCAPQFITEVISMSPQLRRVEIFECDELTDEDLRSLAHASELQTLIVNGSSSSGSFCDALNRHAGFRSLILHHSEISLDGLVSISNLQSLHYLDLRADSSGVSLPLCISNLNSLNTLDVVGFEGTRTEMEALEKLMPNTSIRWY